MSMMPRYRTGRGIRKHLDFIVTDFVILEVSFFLAVQGYNILFRPTYQYQDAIRQQAFILFVTEIISLIVTLPYRDIMHRDKWKELLETIKHAATLALFDVVLMYFMHQRTSFSRITFMMTWGVYIVLELTFRLVWKRRVRKSLLKKQSSRRQVIVLTEREKADDLVANMNYAVLRDFNVVGVFLTDYNRDTDGELSYRKVPVYGNGDDMLEYAIHNWVDEVIFDVSDRALTEKLSNDFDVMGIPTHETVARVNEKGKTSYVERMGNFVVLTNKTREVPPLQMTLKRVLDITGGIVGSFFAVIIIIIVGPIIKKQSPGPIIFAQERVGQNGKTFKMYKIRSMYMDAEERKAALMAQNKVQDGFMFKMDDDPRIIGSEKKDKDGKPKGIGNFIRKTSLDEFPQFFNVLKGDMSLVGTRPPTLDEWEKYSIEHRKRLAIRPGITGLWQISGRSDITDFDEVVRLDSEYIDNWTVGMDIRILIKTVTSVLKHEGAE